MTKKNARLSIVSMAALAVLITALSLTGCDQTMAREFGGSITLTLEPNQKLEMITWKDDDSLWYLTRPMREDEDPETHTFQQSSEFGVFEGTVTVVEVKE